MNSFLDEIFLSKILKTKTTFKRLGHQRNKKLGIKCMRHPINSAIPINILNESYNLITDLDISIIDKKEKKWN